MRTGDPAGINPGRRMNNRMPFKEKNGLARENCFDFSLFIGESMDLGKITFSTIALDKNVPARRSLKICNCSLIYFNFYQ